jgi:succinoglycan biosynthesis protein ExoM
MLRILLHSILECDVKPAFTECILIWVIDNDTDGSAKKIIDDLASFINPKFKVDYSVEPRKGITMIRNNLMSKALQANSDFMIFLDDDEYVSREWLNQLIECADRDHADVVRGPVVAVTEENTPNQIAYWFKRPCYPENSIVDTLETNNLLLNCSMLRNLNVRFDERFNFTGSSDTFFGIQLKKRGIRFYWAEKAVVYEKIPQSRANLKWIIKRIYRGASTYTYILKLEKDVPGLVRKFLISLVYILIGTLTSIFLLFNFKWKYWGIFKLAEGIGGLGGFLNILYKEYK